MIIYYSGTGNSLQIAKDIAEKTGDQILSILNAKAIDLSKETKIGFVVPVYHFNMPSFVQRMLEELDLPSPAYYFVVVCHGGDKGNTAFGVKKILAEKGCTLSYSSDIKMPVNSRIMYGLVTDQIEKRISASKAKIVIISNDINSQTLNAKKLKRIGILDWIAGYTNGESSRKRLTPAIDPFLCVNCGICIKVCPVENIELKKSLPHIENRCEQCMTCMHWCPQTAIHYPNRRIKKKQQYHHPDARWNDVSR